MNLFMSFTEQDQLIYDLSNIFVFVHFFWRCPLSRQGRPTGVYNNWPGIFRTRAGVCYTTFVPVVYPHTALAVLKQTSQSELSDVLTSSEQLCSMYIISLHTCSEFKSNRFSTFVVCMKHNIRFIDQVMSGKGILFSIICSCLLAINSQSVIK